MATKNIVTESKKSEKVHLDPAFVSKFALQKLRKEDSEINVILPLDIASEFMFTYKNDVFSKLPFQIHLLHNQMVLKICFESKNEDDLALLDKLTSLAIKKGGTIKSNRKTLDLISPYLAQRILGNHNMIL